MRFAAMSILVLATQAGCALSHQRADVSDEPRFASSASLAIDESFLYWADPGRGSVVRAPRGGGAVMALAAASPALYTPIALTPTDLVWVNQIDGIEVWRVPLEGGGPRTRISAGTGGPIGVAADARHAYFSRGETGFDLVEVDLATGVERVLAPDLPALGLVIDGEDLIGTSCNPEGVWRLSRETGVRSVITGTFCPISIALDGDHVFFGDYAEPMNPGVGGVGIFRAPSSGGVAERVTISDVFTFAVHRGLVYTARGGFLVQVAPDGSAIELAPADDVRGIAVDDDFVYWTHGSPSGSLDLAFAPLP